MNNFQSLNRIYKRIKLRLTELRLREYGAYSPDKGELLSQKRKMFTNITNTLSKP